MFGIDCLRELLTSHRKKGENTIEARELLKRKFRAASLQRYRLSLQIYNDSTYLPLFFGNVEGSEEIDVVN